MGYDGEGRRRAAAPAPCLSGRGGEAGSWGSWGRPANLAARLRRMREKCAAPCAPLHGDFLNMVRSPISPPCQHIGVWRMLRIEPRPFLPGPSHSYPVQRPHPGGCKKRPRENLTGCVANCLRESSGCQPVRPSAQRSLAEIEGGLVPLRDRGPFEVLNARPRPLSARCIHALPPSASSMLMTGCVCMSAGHGRRLGRALSALLAL